MFWMQVQITSPGTVTSVGRKLILKELLGNPKRYWGLRKGRKIMNRSKIEWCDHTWNPVTGCRHGCPYCYAEKMSARFAGNVRLNKMAKKDYSLVPAADGGEDLYVLDAPMLNETGHPLAYPFGFEPTLYRYRLDTPAKLKMGNNIFVGAMADVFGAWVPDSWLDEIFAACGKYPVHNYLFLTKNPDRYLQYHVPDSRENLWFGTSITKEEEMARILSLPKACKTFISIEPVLEDLHPERQSALFGLIDWVIIGAETGNRKDVTVPRKEWVESIIKECRKYGRPVFLKDSLIPVIGEHNMIREFPEQLQDSKPSLKMQKKLYGICAECGVRLKRSDLITLLVKYRRTEYPKQLGFMCRECFEKFCKSRSLDITKPSKTTEKKESCNDEKKKL